MRRAALLLVLAVLGCGPMIYGGSHGAQPANHFQVVIHNTDIGADETASLCWWMGSSYVGSRDLLVEAGGSRTFDLGTIHPDGVQIVMTAWPGIIYGPGGNVFETPDYADTWTFNVAYPRGGTWKGP